MRKRLNKSTKHDYFDVVDTEYKAYILGFIYADGSVKANSSNRQKSLNISIQEEDGYILLPLLKDIRNVNKYVIRNPPSTIKNGWKKQATANFSSDQICNNLINYGCNIRKSSVGMTFPDLEPEFISHFIRGFFDGDGSIVSDIPKYTYKRVATFKIKKPHIDKIRRRLFFISTDKIFLQHIADVFKSKVGVKYGPYWREQQKTNLTYYMSFESLKDVEKIREYLYADANYYLNRKHKKFYETISSEARIARTFRD